jgi:glutaredoxin 3|tara:strand:- start:4440 stop:4679 length:240 start_codon:yes stop_codon:yes gene_type:complete
MQIAIYSKDNCPYCDMAVRKAESLQDSNKAEFKVFKLGVDFTREQLFELFPTARTFPQIIIDGQSIGGWNQFEEYCVGY